jgi:hypothetical protein
MPREILTHPIPQPAMWEELNFLIHKLEDLGHRDCQVTFGFAWANDFYPNDKWEEITLTGIKLVAAVRKLEGSSAGKLGSDDLFIRVPPLGVKFQFCNDSDIHIWFEEPNEFTELFYTRWRDRGYTPAEWIKTKEKNEKRREN